MSGALGAAAASVLFAAGCGGDGPAAPPPDLDFCGLARDLRVQIPGAGAGLTEEQEADLTARVIPGGFGGLYQEFGADLGPGPGVLVAYFKDPGRTSEGVRALVDVLTCGAAYPGWAGVLLNVAAMRTAAGQYTATELLAFLQALTGLRGDPEVWAIAGDPELNRIWIGVENAAARARIEQAVVAASVPLGAVVVEESPAPVDPPPPFEILEQSQQIKENIGFPGFFEFVITVRYTNGTAETRYPDQCASTGPTGPNDFFLFTLTRWNGVQWVRVYTPICEAVLLAPRPVPAGGQATDTAAPIVSRRLNLVPYWHAARITGTYRFEGFVYRATTNSPPFLADLVPLAERVSSPFRLIR